MISKRYFDGYFARGFDEYYPDTTETSIYSISACRELFRFSIKLNGQTLTPVQQVLRGDLQKFAERRYLEALQLPQNNLVPCSCMS